MSEISQTETKLRRDVPVVIAGSASYRLGEEIAWGLGGYVHPVKIERFADGEIGIELEASIRKRPVFIIQTIAAPLHDNLMELILLIDACRRASAGEITVVVPYLAYSRQDRKAKPRVPISAKAVARMIETAGADRLMTFDMHSGQVQGFYEIPCDNLPGAEVLAPVVAKTLVDPGSVCVVATDVGGMYRARQFAARLGNDVALAVVDKRRARANVVESAAVIGDVSGMSCILVDDMIDTAGTLAAAAQALRVAGATSVSAVATHGLFNGDAVRKIAGAGLNKLWLTDTLTLPDDVKGLRGVEVVSVAPLLVKVIKRVTEGDSLQEIYG